MEVGGRFVNRCSTLYSWMACNNHTPSWTVWMIVCARCMNIVTIEWRRNSISSGKLTRSSDIRYCECRTSSLSLSMYPWIWHFPKYFQPRMTLSSFHPCVQAFSCEWVNIQWKNFKTSDQSFHQQTNGSSFTLTSSFHFFFSLSYLNLKILFQESNVHTKI